MCLFRYSQIPQTLTAAVSSRIDYRPLWLSQRREKLRAGNFVGLQKSSWSVKKKRRRKRMTKTVAVFQMDSQCRIRSTKACVSHLVPPCFWWILTHWWHFTEAESADASVLHLFTHDTKQNKGMPPAFFFSLSAVLKTHLHRHEKIVLCTLVAPLHLLPTTATTARVPFQTQCPFEEQLGASWTARTLREPAAALKVTLKRLASSPQRLDSCIQNHCGTCGNNCTIHCSCLSWVSWVL